MKFLVVCLFVLLTGCATVVPVTAKFPDAPIILTQQCPDLTKIEGDRVAITEMLRVVVQNYSLYWECAAKVDGWNKWYTEQKILFDIVNK
jgi:hypothetical protein